MCYLVASLLLFFSPIVGGVALELRGGHGLAGALLGTLGAWVVVRIGDVALQALERREARRALRARQTALQPWFPGYERLAKRFEWLELHTALTPGQSVTARRLPQLDCLDIGCGFPAWLPPWELASPAQGHARVLHFDEAAREVVLTRELYVWIAFQGVVIGYKTGTVPISDDEEDGVWCRTISTPALARFEAALEERGAAEVVLWDGHAQTPALARRGSWARQLVFSARPVALS